MILPDVNVFVAAHRNDLPAHDRHLSWLRAELASGRAFGLSELALAAMVRIVTNRRVFVDPSSTEQALTFCGELLGHPATVTVRPGSRHWPIFDELCRTTDAKANVVPDAYYAALAIEHGAEWITNDRGFSRFPGLRWRTPFET
ncbi:MAG: type II toxin-antitoxin system VapC family toxin [Acidimicrobiia bacterium]|nr:type II toxin-antitoxin system VapC family toxin [Acidimicrobiia bacterium]